VVRGKIIFFVAFVEFVVFIKQADISNVYYKRKKNYLHYLLTKVNYCVINKDSWYSQIISWR